MLAARNQPLHIAIYDDEPIDRRQIADLTNEIMGAERQACSVSGYESAAALRKPGDNTAIIFTPSNRKMALRGYEVSVARYLPLREEQLRQALLYCYKTFCEGKEIPLPTAKSQRSRQPRKAHCGNRPQENVSCLAAFNAVYAATAMHCGQTVPPPTAATLSSGRPGTPAAAPWRQGRRARQSGSPSPPIRSHRHSKLILMGLAPCVALF